jgi:hypothetical protein
MITIEEIDKHYIGRDGEMATLNISAGTIYKLIRDFIEKGGQINFVNQINVDQLKTYDKIYPIGGSGYGRCAAFHLIYKDIFPNKIMLPHGMFNGYEFLHDWYSPYLSIGRFNAKKILYSNSGKVRAGDQFGRINELDANEYNNSTLTIDFWKDVKYLKNNNISDEDVINIIREYEKKTKLLNQKIDEIKRWFDNEYYRFGNTEKKEFITFNETLSPLLIRLMKKNLEYYNGYTIFALNIIS